MDDERAGGDVCELGGGNGGASDNAGLLMFGGEALGRSGEDGGLLFVLDLVITRRRLGGGSSL